MKTTPIISGKNTNHHDQVITEQSLSTKKISVKIVVKLGKEILIFVSIIIKINRRILWARTRNLLSQSQTLYQLR